VFVNAPDPVGAGFVKSYEVHRLSEVEWPNQVMPIWHFSSD